MATIGPSGVRALPVAAGKTKVATIFDICLLVVVGVGQSRRIVTTIFDIFPLLLLVVGVGTLLAFTPEGIVVGF